MKKISKIENPKLFIAVLVLFALSLGVLVVGITGLGNDERDNFQESNSVSESIQDEEAVSDFFEKEFARSEGLGREGEFEEDPFRQVCVGLGTGELPVFSGFTTCVR